MLYWEIFVIISRLTGKWITILFESNKKSFFYQIWADYVPFIKDSK